jgi:hypothetical protein
LEYGETVRLRERKRERERERERERDRRGPYERGPILLCADPWIRASMGSWFAGKKDSCEDEGCERDLLSLLRMMAGSVLVHGGAMEIPWNSFSDRGSFVRSVELYVYSQMRARPHASPPRAGR